MKLAHRINLILLPVIFGVFSLSGLFAYQEFYRHAEQGLINRLTEEIRLLGLKIEHVTHATKSSAANILNSSQIISFLNTQSPEYQAYVFEALLYDLFSQVQHYEEGLETIQVLTSAEELIVSADNQNPFARTIAPVPPVVFEQYRQQKQGRERTTFKNIDCIFRSPSGDFKYGLLQPFSPYLLIDDETVPVAGAHYLFFAVSRLAEIDTFVSQLQTAYNNKATVKLTPRMNLTESTGEIKCEVMPSGDLFIKQMGNLLELELTMPASILQEELAPLRQKITLLVVLTTLFCFGVLRLLIQRQILKPIATLIKKIKKSREGDSFFLHPLSSDDEVAELNNAYIELFSDVHHIASHDSLTGLANRRNFHRLLDRQLHSQKLQQKKMALLYIDLDNFKRVNDLFGHEIGDRVLQAFSTKLVELSRPTDFVVTMGNQQPARLAGDEFALLLNDIPSAEAAAHVAQRILDLFHGGFEVDGTTYNVHVSIGIATVPEDGEQQDVLLKHADAAMYQAKASGKNCYRFFTQAIAEELAQKQRIDHLLHRAICDNGFELVFMPIFDIEDLTVAGAEVLIRCPMLAAENIGPDQFIPIAESTGLIKEIDVWVVEHSFSRLAELCKVQPFKGILAINISAVELHNDKFTGTVKRLLEKYQIDPERVEFEITETSLMPNDDHSINTLKTLKDMGISLSLDDFGTGFTAFNQLANYPVDCLKIDRSFVNNTSARSQNKQRMVDIILSLAQLYELRVVAEGVETEEQLKYLQDLGCKYAQGYLLSKPKVWEDVVPMLTRY